MKTPRLDYLYRGLGSAKDFLIILPDRVAKRLEQVIYAIYKDYFDRDKANNDRRKNDEGN